MTLTEGGPANPARRSRVHKRLTLFLGEVQGCYVRFWWWDVLLHTGSGFLLGITGFLLVHILNEHDDIDVHMKPRFVDGIGALVISIAGWGYLKTAGTESFLERWIDAFIESNPRMFGGTAS